MQVGLTDSHRESGCRHIVTSIQVDCEERGRVVAEQSLSLRFALLHFEMRIEVLRRALLKSGGTSRMRKTA